MKTRRWPTFQLRTLLLAVVILSGWLGMAAYQARRQRSFVADIEAIYGRVMYDYQVPDGTTFDTKGTSSIPHWLLATCGRDYFHNVVWVDLDSPAVTDASLKLLAGLRKLQCVHISNTSITNEGLLHLKALRRLKKLTINTSGIGDAGMVHLARLPAIESLEIDDARISDSGLKQLQQLTNLNYLRLEQTDVTEAGVEEIRKALPKCCVEY